MRKILYGTVLGMFLVAPAYAMDQMDKDIALATRMGEAAVESGIATSYSLSAWNRSLDINIGSMLPGDARTVANVACATFRKAGIEFYTTVRVFLVVGDRPAAVCQK